MNRKGISLAAAITLAGLGLTACGGSSSGGADASGVLDVYGTEPQVDLQAGNVNETGGGRVVDMTYAGLVYYTADGLVKNDLAKEITSADEKTWKITLEKDRTFSDGSPITADSFINAWNYVANPKNAQLSASWFDIFEGAPELEEDAKDVPDVPALSGLKKIDDLTFEVTLKEPTSDFKERLGYPVYGPLPEVALKDMKAWGQNPTVTSGPYKVKDKGWVHNESITLEKNDKYTGPRKAENDGVVIHIYSKPEAAYADVQAGRLDVLDEVPAGNLATYKKDFGDRAISKDVAIFQSFSIPVDAEHFKMDEEGKLRRQAISMAINREEICDKIFSGTRTPADDFSSPAIGAYSKVKGLIKGSEVVKYNPEKAKELWAKADAIKPFSGKFELGYNADANHKEWVDAVTNSIKNTLGIEAEGKGTPDFKSFRDDITNRKVKNAFRTGWQGDYPGISNFLEPIYKTGASANDVDYANPEFDNLMVEIAKTGDEDARLKLLADAESVLFTDLPAIPLWYSTANAVHSDKVKNVKISWNSVPVYNEIVKVAK